jgi:hypothetical protein
VQEVERACRRSQIGDGPPIEVNIVRHRRARLVRFLQKHPVQTILIDLSTGAGEGLQQPLPEAVVGVAGQRRAARIDGGELSILVIAERGDVLPAGRLNAGVEAGHPAISGVADRLYHRPAHILGGQEIVPRSVTIVGGHAAERLTPPTGAA